MLPPNTYLVLDIPSPFAERVLAIRERHRDVFRSSLPAEVTLAGSSGVGPIAYDEDAEHVIRVMDEIAATTPPLGVSFGRARRFPRSEVFYLSFADEAPLRALHARIASSGLRFTATQFPFTPHCTLRSRGPVSAADAADLLAVSIPGGFVLDTLSWYDLPPRTMDGTFATLLCLLHRVRLVGPARP